MRFPVAEYRHKWHLSFAPFPFFLWKCAQLFTKCASLWAPQEWVVFFFFFLFFFGFRWWPLVLKKISRGIFLLINLLLGPELARSAPSFPRLLPHQYPIFLHILFFSIFRPAKGVFDHPQPKARAPNTVPGFAPILAFYLGRSAATFSVWCYLVSYLFAFMC